MKCCYSFLVLLFLFSALKNVHFIFAQTIQQDVHLQEHNQSQELGNGTIEVTSTTEKVVCHHSPTVDQRKSSLFWTRQRLLVEGQYAYLSIVFLICLMLACFSWMRGFHVRHGRKMIVSFNDESNLLTVKEVLIRKAHYLPMFHQKDELKQVFIHDCGNDP